MALTECTGSEGMVFIEEMNVRHLDSEAHHPNH